MIGREAANIDCYSTLLDPNGDPRSTAIEAVLTVLNY